MYEYSDQTIYEKPKKKTSFLALLGAVLLAFIGISSASKSIKTFLVGENDAPINNSQPLKANSSSDVQRVLMKSANQLNRTLPIILNKHIRLFSVTSSPTEKKLILYFAILDLNREVSEEELTELVRPGLISLYKTSPGLEFARKHNVELVADYIDEYGNVLASISISPKDF